MVVFMTPTTSPQKRKEKKQQNKFKQENFPEIVSSKGTGIPCAKVRHHINYVKTYIRSIRCPFLYEMKIMVVHQEVAFSEKVF